MILTGFWKTISTMMERIERFDEIRRVIQISYEQDTCGFMESVRYEDAVKSRRSLAESMFITCEEKIRT